MKKATTKSERELKDEDKKGLFERVSRDKVIKINSTKNRGKGKPNSSKEYEDKKQLKVLFPKF